MAKLSAPKWAAGLSESINKERDHWIATSPMGKVKVFFTPKNNFGVMDHDVVLENGRRFHNPLRVIQNNAGAEVVFTLFRQPEATDVDFAKDAEKVKSDLERLEFLLESPPSG